MLQQLYAPPHLSSSPFSHTRAPSEPSTLRHRPLSHLPLRSLLPPSRPCFPQSFEFDVSLLLPRWLKEQRRSLHSFGLRLCLSHSLPPIPIPPRYCAMTRRLTIGSRSEMGLETPILSDPPSQPDRFPLNWTTAVKPDFWKKPSKWQICMPRLRLIAKFAVSFVFLVLVLKVLNDKPPALHTQTPQKPPTEAEAREAEKRTNWLWKDYPTYDALRSCSGGRC